MVGMRRGMRTAMAKASYGVMSNTLKPLTNAHSVRLVDPHLIYKSVQISNVFMMKYTFFSSAIKVFMIFL